jgi:hypothetical protein
VNVTEEPVQVGFEPDVIAMAIVGVMLLFTTTVVVPTALVHPATVTVTLYVPAIAALAEGLVGFWTVDV